MSNIGKPLAKDLADVAKHVKARLFDEERKKRIFNPTTRTIGVSYVLISVESGILNSGSLKFLYIEYFFYIIHNIFNYLGNSTFQYVEFFFIL